ncbi:MAG TPA: AMP-dependent synthetase/ligase [Alphaproteobacteria bacterium]|nr:AMP-dependent synthetase/ligase [Alphaproteobacteria bacterium]
MDYKSILNLPRMFFDRAEERGERAFLWAKTAGRYRPLSWREAANQVSRLSRGLRALGIERGDRVALVAENRPEWVIADLAIMAAGAITVPGYVTNTVDDHRHILNNTGAKAAIVSTRKLSGNLLAAARQTPTMRFVVNIEPLSLSQHPGIEVTGWDEVLARGAATPDDVAAVTGGIARSETCCIIHTSGTGGVPRGVALSHGAIICNCMGAEALLRQLGLADETFLSFLPLSHSYEHAAGLFFPISIGAQIYYAEGADTLAANMLEARPTIMTAVPRLYETLHTRITAGIRREGGLKARLFWRTVELGKKRYHERDSLSLRERLENLLLELLVRRKLRARFGGRLKALVSGGAPLNPEVGLFFTALGLRLLQGYGQTEAAPVVSCNPPHKVKLHTVGPPLKDVAVRIAEDGEILVRGELVMQGYWNDREGTAQVLKDGWLHTGDVGLLDADGYIQITDRKKDIIVNSGGDNVSPQRVEGFLTLEPEIAQAMVYGDRQPYLVAVIVPRQDFVEEWAAAHGKRPDLAEFATEKAFHEAVGQAVERVNARLSPIERVRRFIIAKESFSLENNMLTPSLKIRRHIIKRVYGGALDALY